MKLDRKIDILWLLSLVALAEGIFANEDLGIEKESTIEVQQQKNEVYWTPERMEKAMPMPLEAKPKAKTPKCTPKKSLGLPNQPRR